MFKAELKSDTLKGIINVVSTLIDEVKFTVTPEGMTLKAVDAAHVAMIEMEIDKEAFDSYEAEDCVLGLDLDKVKSILKLAVSGDSIKMQHDESQGRLVFRVGNITRRMNLVDTSTMNDPKVPQLSLSTDVSLLVDELKMGIRAADSVSDHILLKAGPGFFQLSCEGDTDSSTLDLGEDSILSLNAESEVRSMFPLDYFANMVKAIPDGTPVTIELDSDYPVKLLFSLAGNHAKVRYLLAPRIESE